jgi:hypothetical protein
MLSILFLQVNSANAAALFTLPDYGRNGDDPSPELYLPLAPLVPEQTQLIITLPEPDTELVFTPEGNLTVNAVAAVKPAEKAGQVEWELEPIGKAKITYEPQRGAAVRIKVKGLPERNDDFGAKTLTARLDGVQDQITLKLFFPPTAKNHPGEGHGKTPNWFYYWSQTKAGKGFDYFYWENPACGGTAVGSYVYSDDRIYLYSSAFGAVCMNRNDGTPAKGIDCFGETIRHEKVHQEELKYWWNNIPNFIGDLDLRGVECDESLASTIGKGLRNKLMGIDRDADLVPDYIEDGLAGCSSDRPISCPGIPPQVIAKAKKQGKAKLDVDMNAYRIAWKQWPIGSADAEDWSECGKQWTGEDCAD